MLAIRFDSAAAARAYIQTQVCKTSFLASIRRTTLFPSRAIAPQSIHYRPVFDRSEIIPRLACVALRTPPIPERLLKLRLT